MRLNDSFKDDVVALFKANVCEMLLEAPRRNKHIFIFIEQFSEISVNAIIHGIDWLTMTSDYSFTIEQIASAMFEKHRFLMITILGAMSRPLEVIK